eukprot:CAMPEP_0180349232 /NCGR_PEP_ID=MMETSP0989-20121125/5354_1 /TAXON_ID=697907 /ORGANISM="non described non described, Strain CCMP2293" /LENGTH=98 /DNA_ID=CAMNT_0022338531 /DNA_START=212 /DNA_END=508 /DNA_ORIENTATION=+
MLSMASRSSRSIWSWEAESDIATRSHRISTCAAGRLRGYSGAERGPSGCLRTANRTAKLQRLTTGGWNLATIGAMPVPGPGVAERPEVGSTASRPGTR